MEEIQKIFLLDSSDSHAALKSYLELSYAPVVQVKFVSLAGIFSINRKASRDPFLQGKLTQYVRMDIFEVLGLLPTINEIYLGIVNDEN